MPKKLVRIAILIIVLSVALSSCAAMGRSDKQVMESAPQEPAMDFDVVEEEYAESQDGYGVGVNSASDVTNRMVMYNAYMEIAVENPETALQSVIDMAEKAGGFVVNSNVYKAYTDRGSLPSANLTVRVPAGELDSIIEAIKGLTPNPEEDVISENVSGQDVTAEYTDLESRLRNLEAAEEALVKMMEEAKEPEDVLNIFEQLTYYRGEIEVVKGRMKYLQESVALSSLTVEIRAKESLRPIEIVGWQPKGTIKNAVEKLIEAGQFLADAVIWFGIFCLPFLIPLGIGVYFLVRFLRKRRAKRQAEKVEVVEEIEPVDESA